MTGDLASALAGRYRIERPLGEGAMATVHLAEDLKHRRRVAIKVLNADLSAHLGPERFLREIEVTAGLQHPHILPLFDSGSAGGRLYYVMPYVEGGSLRGRLERETQLPVADAIRIATEIADALAYAHKRGVIHRDIKPENILLQDGRALLADFGIALAVQQAGGTRTTQAGLSLGTPQYMAPEQAMAEPVIDARADVYALGAVTYEMLSGDPPFTGPNTQAIVAKSMTERPRALRTTRDTIPSAVDEAVATALAKLPADRFGSASEFALAIAQRNGTDRRRLGPETVAAALQPGAAGYWKRTAVAAVLAAVVLGGVAIWGWQRSPVTPRPMLAALSVPLPAGTLLAPSFSVALSRDGSRLAFPAVANGKRLLYVRDLRDMTARALPGTEEATDPFFSPDGRRVGFSAAGALWTVAVVGGVPDEIPGTNDGSIDPGGGIDGATWTDGDTVLYAPRFRSGRGILRVPAAGGAPTSVAVPDTAAGEVSLGQPGVLPGGQNLLAIVTVKGTRERRVGIVSLATGRVRRLNVGAISAQYASGHLLYTPGDGGVYATRLNAASGAVTGDAVRLPGIDGLVGTSFSVSEAGVLVYMGGAPAVSHLVQVGRDGHAQVLDDSARSYDVPRVSPDGRRIAVGAGSHVGMRDIWVFDLGRQSLERLTRGGDNICPLWTLDGTRVAFSASVDGTYDIVSLPADRPGPADTLVRGGQFHFAGAFSPDGKWLIYRQNDLRTNEDLFAVSLDSTHTVRTLVATPFTEVSPALSSDGRWLAYVSDASGRREVYVRRFDGSGATLQVSVAGGDEPRWAPGGREMYYRTADTLFAVPVTVGPRGISPGKPAALFADQFRSSERYTDYDVLPTGAGFIMLAPQRDAPLDVRVVMGWQAMLEPPGRH
jgi:eukaryotic-like serine/threonine-protein kinase